WRVVRTGVDSRTSLGWHGRSRRRAGDLMTAQAARAAGTPGTVPSDAELIDRTVAGEREAFSELVRRYQRALYAHACSMGMAHDPALDLVQEAFVRAFVRIRQCRDRTHFRAWLF